MNRQLLGDLRVRQVFNQLEAGCRPTVDDDSALAAMIGAAFRSGITAIINMSGAPDVLDPVVAGHCLDQPALALDDGVPHLVRRARVGQIAIGLAEPHHAVDAQQIEGAGDAAGQEFPLHRRNRRGLHLDQIRPHALGV